MSHLRAITTAFPIAVFVWQAVGAAITFTRGAGSRGLSQLIAFGFIGLMINASSVVPNPWLVAAGSAGLLGALVLFEWARRTIRGRFFSYIFSEDTPAFLCTDGPYAYVRNPFYSSYLLSMGSTALMLPGLHRWLIVLAALAYFSWAAMFEERKFGKSEIAREYEAYKQRTGRFLPRRS